MIMNWTRGRSIFLVVWTAAAATGAALWGLMAALFACCGQAHPPLPGVVRAAIWEAAVPGALIGAVVGFPIALCAGAVGAWLFRRSPGTGSAHHA